MNQSQTYNPHEQQDRRNQQGQPRPVQTIVQSSVNAYAGFLSSALSLYQQGLATAGQIALSPLRLTVWAAQQSARSPIRVTPVSQAAGSVASRSSVREATSQQSTETTEEDSWGDAKVSGESGTEVVTRQEDAVAAAVPVAQSEVHEEIVPQSSEVARGRAEAADQAAQQQEDAEITGWSAQRDSEAVDETTHSDAETPDRADEGLDRAGRTSSVLELPPTTEKSLTVEEPPPAAREEPVVAEEPATAVEETEPPAYEASSILGELPPPPEVEEVELPPPPQAPPSILDELPPPPVPEQQDVSAEPSAEPAVEEAPRTEGLQVRRVTATEAAHRKAEELGVDLLEVEGSGPNGRITVDDVRRAGKQARP